MGCRVLSPRPRPGRGERRKNFACGGRKLVTTSGSAKSTRRAHRPTRGGLRAVVGRLCRYGTCGRAVLPRLRFLRTRCYPSIVAVAAARRQPGECKFGFRDAFCRPLHARNLSMLGQGGGLKVVWKGFGRSIKMKENFADLIFQNFWSKTAEIGKIFRAI